MTPPHEEGRCPYHVDHENRIERLEGSMEKVLEHINKFSPSVLIAFFGLVGTCVATVGSIVGVVISAALKAQGWLQ